MENENNLQKPSGASVPICAILKWNVDTLWYLEKAGYKRHSTETYKKYLLISRVGNDMFIFHDVEELPEPVFVFIYNKECKVQSCGTL